jgi:putative N6-adenine-specific DNA methylase
MKLELIATTTFGLEAVVKREIQDLGYRIISTEDGKVTFLGDDNAIARSNLWLRTADRILLKMGEFKAETFEELFQQTKALPWGNYIALDGEFPVNGSSVKSKLSSIPACQSIVKKAIVESLREYYCQDILNESGEKYSVKVTLLKDRATLTMDTSGAGLHKRGYRVNDVKAPIKETLAAAMVLLSFWNKERLLIDPCCGSGTIPIEAALIGRNIAPGLNRSFASEKWDCFDNGIWKAERKKAFEQIDYSSELRITGIDIEEEAISAAKNNAAEAGVDEDIRFINMDMKKLKITNDENGIIITNPPYGERIGDTNIKNKIYDKLNRLIIENPRWSLFMITTDKNIEEKIFSRKADRRRKLYNGRLETCYYQFHGEKKRHED